MTTPFRGRAATTSTAVAVTEPAATGGLTTRAEDVRLDLELATMLAGSDLVPKAYKGKAENILIAVGLGRALGIDPVPSLYALHVIEGTPSPTAKTQQALVRRAGHKFRTLESTSERCTVQIERSDDPGYPTTVTFTLDDARKAHLLDRWMQRWVKNDGYNRLEKWILPDSGFNDPDHPTVDELTAAGAPEWTHRCQVSRKDNWFTQPTAMLHARATTACVGQACSEVLSGIDFDTPMTEIDDDAVVAAAQLTDLIAPPADTAGDEIVDAEIVQDPSPGDEAPATPTAAEPTPGEATPADPTSGQDPTPGPFVWVGGIDHLRNDLRANKVTFTNAIRAAAAADPDVHSLEGILTSEAGADAVKALLEDGAS